MSSAESAELAEAHENQTKPSSVETTELKSHGCVASRDVFGAKHESGMRDDEGWWQEIRNQIS